MRLDATNSRPVQATYAARLRALLGGSVDRPQSG